MPTTRQSLDEMTREALALLGSARHDGPGDPAIWDAQVQHLATQYADLYSRRAFHVLPPVSGTSGDGPVDVRGIVGEVLLATPAAHRLYHTDAAMRHGIEVAMAVLSTVADVLVGEGDTPELAAHIIHLAAHKLSGNTPPPGVDLDALGTANTALDLTDPDRAVTPGQGDV